MAWTKAQQKVIDTRNKNLLVSAAAGSGKTAVLVERIICMISEGENPLDIDRLLVVTFTNAAAAEMRERIGKAIEDKLEKNPGNLHLQKQISLLQSAQITTIHSFCLNVIRNYFHRIDLDPSFKIADESEITLMKSDVISEILERWYEDGSEEFHAFVESYSYSKSDTPIEELILQLFNFSMSDPWPKVWIDDKKKMFELKSLEEMYEASWMKELMDYIDVVLADLLVKCMEAISVCNESDGPAAYLPALLSDRNMLENMRKAKTYEEAYSVFSGIAFDRLSSKKEEGVALWKKDKVKELREEVKKGLKDLTSQYFFQSPEEMLKDLQEVDRVMKVLFTLTIEFMEEFAKKKEEKNLIDFNDLEHFALKILVKEEESEGALSTSAGRGKTPTQAALELSELFEEILIDEYQDSNMVQETILRSISREELGRPNRFMVGDVKQSIYKFRLAMPEIFMEKYETYSTEATDSDGNVNNYQRIDLDKNFRSRKTVLDYVNKIFEQIMQKSVGGIIYDEAASLKYGELYDVSEPASESEAEFGENYTERIACEVDFLLVTEDEPESRNEHENTSEPKNIEELKNSVDNIKLKGKPSDSGTSSGGSGILSEASGSSSDAGTSTSVTQEDEEEEAAYTKKEIEARVIAKKIKELTDPDTGMLVMDKKTKALRPACYRDIVILLRSMSNWSEVFVNTLMNEGVPAYADTGTGYFQTLEIMTLLNMLRIIDNPRQDIPLTGVLYSPIVGLSTTELAELRVSSRNVCMYSAITAYLQEGSDEDLRNKLLKFMGLLENYRSLVNHKPIHELIQLVLDETGYYYYVSAMPGGDRRSANIDMLVSQAVRFEKGSYSGLFHFIRYIEKLHKYEVDFGEASTAGEQEDTIRIMSIHKSKGLEFPVVFVAGMSKQFNTQDLRSSIVLHSELGAGPEYIDSKLRTKVPTLLKKVIQKKVQTENLGEELRVLYVAMTRAKEKLILTGYLKSMEDIVKKGFSFFELMSAKSYMDWVLPAMLNRMGKLFDQRSLPLEWKQDNMTIRVIPLSDILKQEIKKQQFLMRDKEELLSINPEETYDSELKQEIKRRFNYEYPYKNEAGLKIKMTVTELKKLGQFQDEEHSVNLYLNKDSKGADINSYEINADKDESQEDESQEDKNQENKNQVDKNRVDKNQLNKNQIDKNVLDDTEINSYRRIEINSYKGADKNSEDFVPTVPDFIRQKESVTSGTDRGTLYHKVLELLDLPRVQSKEELHQDLGRIIRENLVNEGDIKKLKLDYIYNFTRSNVAERMRKASSIQKLFKEKQFVMGIKASEVMKESDSKELILIQGIIDVFFEENGELVLLDYKSDLVENEDQLVRRYKVQLEYYKRALEQMLKQRVKEMIIYSLPLGKEIRVEC